MKPINCIFVQRNHPWKTTLPKHLSLQQDQFKMTANKEDIALGLNITFQPSQHFVPIEPYFYCYYFLLSNISHTFITKVLTKACIMSQCFFTLYQLKKLVHEQHLIFIYSDYQKNLLEIAHRKVKWIHFEKTLSLTFVHLLICCMSKVLKVYCLSTYQQQKENLK